MTVSNFKWIPSVNEFLSKVKAEFMFSEFEHDLLVKHIRAYIDKIKREELIIEKDKDFVLTSYLEYLKQIFRCPLKPVINATGIVLHTNLGRAPLSDSIFELLKNNCLNYTNIELDLISGKRAYRDDYLKDIFNFITGTEDVIIVNNNAAALYLILKHYANDREVLISRGELIEIGGSFRIPDIMVDSGAILKEVGTTNCTRINDFEKAINENTALIFKAHTSNFTISGHTESVSIDELVALAKKYNIPFVYDAGSGLIKKTGFLKESSEPEVSECLEKGVDIVCFSGDKLLGASQAGIILGKSNFLTPMKKHPLMRVLRVDKLTISNIYHYISLFKSEKELIEKNKIFSLLSQSEEELLSKAKLLSNQLQKNGIHNKILKSFAQTGGGALPELLLPSYEIQLELDSIKNSGEQIYFSMLKLENPILAILKERKVFFNVFTIDFSEIDNIVNQLKKFF